MHIIPHLCFMEYFSIFNESFNWYLVDQTWPYPLFIIKKIKGFKQKINYIFRICFKYILKTVFENKI